MLDYTTREKKALSVKLIDGKTVLLTAPKKSLYTKLTALESKTEGRTGSRAVVRRHFAVDRRHSFVEQNGGKIYGRRRGRNYGY